MTPGFGLRRCGAAFLFAAAAALPGCALLADPPQTAALRAAAPADLPPRVERDAVPFYPQTPLHCGPAALATVLADVGLPADLTAISDAVFLPAREGSLQIEMLSGARRQGAVATRLPGELTALMREVAAGHAVVVLLNLGLDFAPRWHYAVLVGYDLPAGELILRSGTIRRDLMSLRTFEYPWARGVRWAIVALPPGQLPATAREADAVDGALGYGRIGAAPDTARAWAAVRQCWPANLLAAMGLGNSLHAAGDLAGAARAFEDAAQQHDSAAAWNNLARTRDALGDRAGARTAAASAVARARSAEPKWLPQAEQTLREVGAGAP
ncbi:MAG: PA2778 family cysteine peptidase [Rubrivivax sp.]|nr:PA2778 family cysteine peptidase [Rubrivivax sp.]